MARAKPGQLNYASGGPAVLLVRFVNRADVKERFLNGGVEVVGSSPAEFAAYINADIARISKLIQQGGIKLN